MKSSLVSPSEKIHQLYILSELLQGLYTDYQSINPHKDWLRSNLSSSQQAYLPLLLELSSGFTLLFHRHRVELKIHIYETSIEDVLTAMGLLQSSLSPLSVVSEGARYVYGKLSNQSSSLTRKEVMAITGYQKSHCQRLLNELYVMGLVERSGHWNKGYQYAAGILET